MRNPYWLIREPGKTIGCGAIEFDSAITSDKAVEVFLDQQDEMMRQLLSPPYHPGLEAVLVTLTYVNDQPVVSEVA